MTVFFYICEYLEITPAEFFDTDYLNPSKVSKLLDVSKDLKDNQLDILINIAKEMKK